MIFAVSAPPLVIAANAWVPAAIGGLGGALLGGCVTLVVAWRTRVAAERSWVRDGRRQIYDRFLTKAQALHAACEAFRVERADGLRARDDLGGEPAGVVQRAYDEFFGVFAVVQAVGGTDVVMKSRIHGYRLEALSCGARGESPMLKEGASFEAISTEVRHARHVVIDAMRGELGLEIRGWEWDADFNGFEGTSLEASVIPKDERQGRSA